MSSKIQVEGLAKTFRASHGAEVQALADIDLAVGDKEFVTLVGPSGCGKSTLLKMIAGLQPATAGRILLDGRPVVRPSPEVGIVFQSPTLLQWRTVLDNVLLPVEILRLDRAAYRRAALELLDLVGLAGFERAMPWELSGGMQHRVAICRALVHNPSVLLMDEPFAALDALTREELALEILRIWQERKTTVVFVTHSIAEAVLLADRVVVMTPRPGRVAQVIEVALPRPRTLDMEYSEAFRRHADAVRALIGARRGP